MFGVEVQGLSGVCSGTGDDPELIPEVNSAFVSRAQVACLQADVTSCSGGHGSPRNKHLLSISFGSDRARCWLSSLNANPAICSPDYTAERSFSNWHQTVPASWSPSERGLQRFALHFPSRARLKQQRSGESIHMVFVLSCL